MMTVAAEPARNLYRLALGGALVVIVGLSRGLDVATTVALCLAVMEIDAHLT